MVENQRNFAVFPISITLFCNHLKWNSPYRLRPFVNCHIKFQKQLSDHPNSAASDQNVPLEFVRILHPPLVMLWVIKWVIITHRKTYFKARTYCLFNRPYWNGLEWPLVTIPINLCGCPLLSNSDFFIVFSFQSNFFWLSRK